jgi:membrane protease YdiL (CAAX protease family)
MGVIYLATTLFDPWVTGSAAWQGFFSGASPLAALFGQRVLLVLEALIVLAALFLMGVKRQDAFLTPGDLNAPAVGNRSSGRGRPVTWIPFGAVMTILLAGSFFALLAALNSLSLASFAAALPWLPLVLLSAALNAFGEEAMFRAAPLAALLPAVGPRHALWMTSVWFGLGHYYGGIPSGPAGAVGSGLLGLLLGKAMLDTRGMGWPWIIHLAIDTTIYLTIAMASAAQL